MIKHSKRDGKKNKILHLLGGGGGLRHYTNNKLLRMLVSFCVSGYRSLPRSVLSSNHILAEFLPGNFYCSGGGREKFQSCFHVSYFHHQRGDPQVGIKMKWNLPTLFSNYLERCRRSK